MDAFDAHVSPYPKQGPGDIVFTISTAQLPGEKSCCRCRIRRNAQPLVHDRVKAPRPNATERNRPENIPASRLRHVPFYKIQCQVNDFIVGLREELL